MIRYIVIVLVALDQFANVLLGGYLDETISRRMAIAASQGRWYGCLFCKVISIIVPDHCDLTKPTKGATYGRQAKDLTSS